MEIVTLDMEKYLGRGIQVYLNNGESFNFKPLQHRKTTNTEWWIGLDDEGIEIAIEKRYILFVKSPVLEKAAATI